MNLYLLFHNIKFKRLFYLFSPLFIYSIWVLLLISFDIQSSMDNNEIFKNEIAIFGGFIAVICSQIIQPFMVIRYVLVYIENKSLLFILYFLFFIFYSLFFILYFLFFTFVNHLTTEVAVVNMYIMDIVSFVFIIAFILFYIFKVEKNIFRYFFAFLTIVSHISIKSIYFSYFTNDITYLTFQTNPVYYTSNFYLITLIFAIIQLSIEAYYFYKERKAKWIRYNRMKKYKESKK